MYKSFLNYINYNIEERFFGSSDTQKILNKNIKRLPKDWIYRTKEITFKTNEGGFRTKPFNQVNWEEAVVVFGCSFIFGIGLAEEDTLCYILEKKLGREVINLGIPGSAVDLNHYNSMILHENFPRPKAIVHCWTSLFRYSDFRNDQVVTATPSTNFYLQINWAKKSKFFVQSDRIVWRNKVVYKEYSFFKESYKELNVPSLDTVDHARDLQHPGILTNQLAAERIAKDLRQQGI